jgi:hypothetical protein
MHVCVNACVSDYVYLYNIDVWAPVYLYTICISVCVIICACVNEHIVIGLRLCGINPLGLHVDVHLMINANVNIDSRSWRCVL